MKTFIERLDDFIAENVVELYIMVVIIEAILIAFILI